LIKEAYEYFDRKYNPQKYANLRMPINNFDEGGESTKADSGNAEDDSKYESIRQKNRKKYTSNNPNEGEEKNKYNFDFSFDERTNFYSGYEETREVFMEKKFKLDKLKNENIAKFLFSKAPVPRSYRMIGNL
jgi:hypothetical protein